MVGDGDIFIGAISIANGETTIITRNKKDFERIPGIKEITRKRKRAYEIGDEADRLRFRNVSPYDLRYHLSLTYFRMTVYTFQWVGSKIVEMASDLGLPQEIIVIQALIAGMTTSGKWIPFRHQNLMFEEMIRFATWVNELAEKS